MMPPIANRLLLCGTACLLSVLFVTPESAAVTPHRITFPSESKSFEGLLYVPEGKGPFPVLVWLHGRAEDLGEPSHYPGLSKAFLSGGYAVFIPDRRLGHVAAGDYSEEVRSLEKKDPKSKDLKEKKYAEFLQMNLRDSMAAVAWIKQHPEADTNRLVLAGWSSGGIMALMAAEKLPGIRAAVVFSPGALSWDSNPIIRSAAIRAVQKTKVPVFLIQASNDPSLKPSESLGKELAKKGPPNQTKIYAFGGKPDVQFSSLPLKGWNVWGYDVLTWLDALWRPQPAP